MRPIPPDAAAAVPSDASETWRSRLSVRPSSIFTSRLARTEDLAALRDLMETAISELQKPFLDAAQIASSRLIMGLDTQLIEDRTYYVVESAGDIAGCGGWSRRATLYGGDQTPGRDRALLVPGTDPARIRAMYTSAKYVRRGVGRAVLGLCEAGARAEGFTKAELVATLAGVPLYLACGYRSLEPFEDDRGGARVPLVRMQKAL